MSADNWARCPRCLSNARAALVRRQAELDASYGSIPLAEFDDLRGRVAAGTEAIEDYESFRTFREDWEIGLVDEGDGEWFASYRGHCNACGAGHDFEQRAVIR